MTNRRETLVNRLRGIYTVPVNDGAGLLNGKDTFTQEFQVTPISREAADEIERLRRQVKLLHDATIVLRNGMGGHQHWDHTMQYGAGCSVCIAQGKARDDADRLINEASLDHFERDDVWSRHEEEIT